MSLDDKLIVDELIKGLDAAGIKSVVIDENTKFPTPKKWMGTWPANCDECGVPLQNYTTFYDARATSGHWGLFCPRCKLSVCGHRIGTGYGQCYDSKTLVKLEG
jgi:hypothetical protein